MYAAVRRLGSSIIEMATNPITGVPTSGTNPVGTRFVYDATLGNRGESWRRGAVSAKVGGVVEDMVTTSSLIAGNLRAALPKVGGFFWGPK